ncbi:hypothetical protein J3Q64DRAFT_1235206 [Phycomyces blakesleeanus]|uniref:RRM domain-containing protein n=1 Tax=Phycomyces blakesleeanus TaxID=4837 RepID=A0ABR3BB16_PHYBL
MYTHTSGSSDQAPKARASQLESRAAMERPCRTLFVRNVQYTIQVSEIRETFEKFGEIKDIFDLIERRGMAFITYYDIRAAEAGKEAMQGAMLKCRMLDVHYSLPKQEEEEARCDRTKNQGTLLLTLKDTDNTINDSELSLYFRQYGEIKVIRTPHFKTHRENTELRQRIIEFYDSRACVNAFDGCHDKPYKGGRWDISFFWDHSFKERTEALAARKEQPNDKKMDGHLNGSRHGRNGGGGNGGGGGGGGGGQRRMGGGIGGQRRDDHHHHHGHHGHSHGHPHHNQRRDSSYDSIPDHNRPLHRYGSYSEESSGPIMSPKTVYDPAIPSMGGPFKPDANQERLEQAQKAQQVLSMLAQTQTVQGVPTQPAFGHPTGTYGGQANGTSTVPPLPQAPAAAQLQQILGLLGQVAMQQQQTQHQQQPLLSSQPQQVPQQQQHQHQHQHQQQQQQEHQIPPHQSHSSYQPSIQQGQQNHMTSSQASSTATPVNTSIALGQLAQLLKHAQQQPEKPSNTGTSSFYYDPYGTRP